MGQTGMLRAFLKVLVLHNYLNIHRSVTFAIVYLTLLSILFAIRITNWNCVSRHLHEP